VTATAAGGDFQDSPFRLDAGRVRTGRFNRLGPLAALARRYARWNWGWRLEIALRYQPVVEALAARPTARRILDIGCGSKGGLTTYLRRPAYGVDVTFDLERVRDHPQLKPVCASGLALPFAAASMDVVVCLDTVEHLAPAARHALVAEMARVVRDDGLLVVGAPCGEAARQAEQLIAEEYRCHTGQAHPKLGEHLEHAAWSCDELRALMEDAAARRFGRYRSRVVPNVNVSAWTAIHRLFDLGQPVPGLTHLQRALLQPLWAAVQPLYPLLARWLHAEPAYRRIVFAEGPLGAQKVSRPCLNWSSWVSMAQPLI
jgi:SAM-dependent methyltransferase